MSAQNNIAAPEVDLRVENHGSVFLLRPLTDAGRTWIEEHVQYESWQMFGGAISMEPRYAAAIVEGAQNDGLNVK